MIICRDYEECPRLLTRPAVVTIGNFDGVHRGHLAVLEAARGEAAATNRELVILTFEPHPDQVLRPAAPRLRLLPAARKLELIAATGPTLILAQRFDAALAALEPRGFAEQVLARSLGAQLVLVGQNFSFGRGRVGDLEHLRRLGQELGFAVRGERLLRLQDEEISSSRIRALVATGEVAAAAVLLGRPHELAGTVQRGQRLGRTLGFPTVNLGGIEVLLPATGIYAARARVGGEVLPAAAYVGRRPTLGGTELAVEAHLIGFSGDLYGAGIVLELVERVRGDARFANLDALREQLARDIRAVRLLLERG